MKEMKREDEGKRYGYDRGDVMCVGGMAGDVLLGDGILGNEMVVSEEVWGDYEF